jgi:hypothetical protein
MPDLRPETNHLTFAGIGEVLFDLFEDKTETLGGAPFNFAFHIHQLARQTGIGEGYIVSSVGNDTSTGHTLDPSQSFFQTFFHKSL